MNEIKLAQPFDASCPSRDILELIGDKWSLLVMCLLKSGPQRTGSMMRTVEGISQKMLTQTLRELERNGIVKRTSYPEVPPRVEYALTPMGETLSVVVFEIEQWVVNHFGDMTAEQEKFDARLGRQPEQLPQTVRDNLGEDIKSSRVIEA